MRGRSMRLSRRRRGKNMKNKSQEVKTSVSEWRQINAAPHERRAVFDALSLVPMGALRLVRDQDGTQRHQFAPWFRLYHG